MSTNLIIIVCLGALSVANVWVCVGVLRSPWYSSTQRAIQCALVWFLPVVGLIVVWSFLRAQSEPQRKDYGFKSQRDQGVSGPEFNNPGASGSGES